MNSNLEMILNISIRIYDWFYNNVNKEKNLEMQKLSSLPFSNEKQSDRYGLSIDLYILRCKKNRIWFPSNLVVSVLHCVYFIKRWENDLVNKLEIRFLFSSQMIRIAW